jgi:putative PIN family toxin of toxin-antitoxin system
LRIVCDTNVLLAAFLTRGACAEVLEYLLDSHEVCVSEHVLLEVETCLNEKFAIRGLSAGSVVPFLRRRCHLVEAGPLGEPACRDPDDDGVLATAVAARADCLLTGDSDLLVIGSFRGIPIIRPAEFWRFERDKG